MRDPAGGLGEQHEKVLTRSQRGPLTVQLVETSSPIAAELEARLGARALGLPLPARVAWGRHIGGPRHLTLVALTSEGDPESMLGVAVTSTRSLPFHRVLRVEAVGDHYATPTGYALMDALAALSRRQPRVLKLVVEVETSADATRRRLTEHLSRLGFRRMRSERVSERTLSIDLAPDEDAIFASLSRRGRQNIRLASKQGLETEALVDPDAVRYAGRLNELLRDALARTGGDPQVVDWKSVLLLCGELPDRSRLVAVFRGPAREPEALVGYAWGLHHGDRVEYSVGASDRIPGVSLPILYPAIWDLVLWGKQHGGAWFDLGGITPGDVGSSDALGGISHFKRGFSKQEVALGEEWVLEPWPIRAALARMSTVAAMKVRGLRRAWHKRSVADASSKADSDHTAAAVPSEVVPDVE